MAGPWQLAELPIGGVDLRTDPMRVAPPKVLEADNVVLNTPGRASKRPGTRVRVSTARTTILPPQTLLASPRDVAVQDARWVGAEPSGRVLCHADGLLLADAGAGRWAVRGLLDQIRMTAGRSLADVEGGSPGAPITQVGRAGRFIVVAWAPADLGGSAGFMLLDGETLSPVTPVWGISARRLRVVTLPNSALIVYRLSAGNILAIPITEAFALEQNQTTFAGITVVADAADPAIFDVCTVNGRAVLAYLNGGGNIARCYIDAAGNLDGAIQTEAPGGGAPVAIAVHHGDTNGRLLIAWGSDAGSTLRARDYNANATLTANAAQTTVDTATGYKQIAIAVRATTWTLIYETGDTVLHNRITQRATWDTSGAPVGPAATDRLRHASLRSRAWTDPGTGRAYVVLAYEAQTLPSAQVTYFVYAVKGGIADVDPTLYEDAWVLVGVLWPQFAGGGCPVPVVSGVYLDGRVARLALPYRYEQTETDAKHALRLVTIEHAPSDMQTLVPGADGASYMPGGMLWRIDEALNAGGVVYAACEAGIVLSPEVEGATATPGAAGALTPGASYNCRYYYRDLCTGERSTAINTKTVALGGAQNSISHTVPTLTHTNRRRRVVVEVWRTLPNPNDSSPFFFAAQANNSRTADTVVISDTLSDAALAKRPRDYLSFGEVDEVTPPACEVVAFGEGRAAVAGFDEDGTVFLSKQRGAGEPIRWSDLVLAVADHPTPGRVTAMAWSGPELVVWRRRSIQVLSGRGPDNTGQGGTLQPAKVVSHELGCRSARTLVRIPSGWVFQADDGTYWQLGLAGELAYVGGEVEARRDLCTGAFALHAQKQVHFVSATGTLVYHYDANAWTTSTRTAISAAATPEGVGLYLPSRSSAKVLEDDPSSYRDSGVEYVQRLRLPWFRPAGIVGEFAVRRLLVAGRFDGPHAPRVRVYYDYEDGHNETFEWAAVEVVDAALQGDGVQVFGGPTRLESTGVYRYAIGLARERCVAVGIEIFDRAVGGANLLGASFGISTVAYEWAPVAAGGSQAFRLEERRMAQKG
jgi:hypothetical protein